MKLPNYEMNRRNFALTYFGAFPVMGIIAFPMVYLSSTEFRVAAMSLVGLFYIALLLIIILRRLDNIGKSKLWFLGLFVPLLNLYTAPMIWSYPPNVKENGMDKKGYSIFVLVLIVTMAGSLLNLIINMADSRSDLAQITAPIEAPADGWNSISEEEAELVIPRCAGLFKNFHQMGLQRPDEYNGWHGDYLENTIAIATDQGAAEKEATPYYNAYNERIHKNVATAPDGAPLAHDELMLADWRNCQAFVDMQPK